MTLTFGFVTLATDIPQGLMARETAVELEDQLRCWLSELSQSPGRIALLLNANPGSRSVAGYLDTLEEICQQPLTWRCTARQLVSFSGCLSQLMDGVQAITLTGSGSSEYAGACVHLGLREDLAILADTVPAGLILTHGSIAIPAVRPGLLISLARSGDSPESITAIQRLLATEPDIRHLVITCNPEGRLARESRTNPRVKALILDSRTNDRGLAMTSSFTNMALAARLIGRLEAPQRCVEIADRLASIAQHILLQRADEIGAFATGDFRKALFLGSGPAFGAAREGALKMLELTDGRVATMAESPLGLRHGPMSWVDPQAAVVLFLSSNPIVRAYECDLLAALDNNRVGLRRIIVGDAVPASICNASTLTIECDGLSDIGDSHSTIAYVLVAQLLAFFRSLHEGLKPDTPSESGVISRVVPKFKIHSAPAGDTQ